MLDLEHALKVGGAAVGSLAVLASSLWGGYAYLDATYAKQADVVLVELRLDQKILADRANQIQARQWRIEDQYGQDLVKAPSMVKEEYRQLEKEKQQALQELDAVYQQQRKQTSK